MSQYYGDIAAGATIRLNFSTNAVDGSAITYTVGTVEVYKDADLTQSIAGVSVSKDHDGKTGAHLVTIVASDAFYVTGANYSVMLINATIDGVTGINAFIGSFSIANRPVQGMAAALITTLVAAFWNTLTASAGAVTTVLGYLLSRLNLITANNLNVSSPVLSSGDVEVVRGDDYLAADGRALLWTSDDWTTLDLSSAQAILFKAKTRYSETILSIEAEALSDTQVQVELTHDDTDTLAVGRNAYKFDLEAELADGSIVTLALGKIHVVEDIR